MDFELYILAELAIDWSRVHTQTLIKFRAQNFYFHWKPVIKQIGLQSEKFDP